MKGSRIFGAFRLLNHKYVFQKSVNLSKHFFFCDIVYTFDENYVFLSFAYLEFSIGAGLSISNSILLKRALKDESNLAGGGGKK